MADFELWYRTEKVLGQDEFKRTVIQSFWTQASKEVNLGSKNKPNVKIKEIKFTPKRRSFQDMFGNLE